jgi:L-ascorbate metabolism protein UlaG (beta-lactamase superfamily)
MTMDGPGRVRAAIALPFFWRRMRASRRPRPGAAPFVPFDAAALDGNPALTWIGHATFFFRVDGASFLTDPVFSERASPLAFVGPSRLGPIDLAALPVGAYEPRAMMGPIHLDPEEAVAAALALDARRVVAMHFGTFDLADEPLDEPPRRFLAEAARRGLGERAFTMAIGETRRL